MEFILYSYFRSSASFRARIAMNLKGLKYEYRAVHLLKGDQLKDDYFRLNPSRQVPTLVHGDRVIAQTMGLIDYLDSIQPQPRLFPTEAYQRALVTQVCEIVNSGTQPFGNTSTMNYLRDVLKLDDVARKAWLNHWLSNGSRALEAVLKSRAGRFAFADEVSAADCFVLPHLVSCERFGAPFADCPTLMRLRENYRGDDAFARAMPDQQPDFEA